MTDFSKLADAVVQYGLSVGGKKPTNSTDALAALKALEQQANTPATPNQGPDVGDLLEVYGYLEIWTSDRLPRLYGALDALLGALNSDELPSRPLPELACADIRAPASPGMSVSSVSKDQDRTDSNPQSESSAALDPADGAKVAAVLRQDADRFIHCARNVLETFEKTWKVASTRADQRLNESPSYGAGPRPPMPPVASLPILAPSPLPNDDNAGGYSIYGAAAMANLTAETRNDGALLASLLLNSVSGPMNSGPWEKEVFYPLRSTIDHFAQDTGALATQYRASTTRRRADQIREPAKSRLKALWATLQDIEASNALTAPAEPYESGKWIDAGAAEDNKMNSLDSSLDMLRYFMQEAFATGAKAYGEFCDILGNRRWRFDIEPTQWAEGLPELSAFTSTLGSAGGTGAVVFSYLDKVADPWQRRKAACIVNLTVEGDLVERGTHTTQFGQQVSYERRMSPKESDQYRDGKERVPVHYGRGA
ncbi:MAG TPA: hypothetical protein VGN46_10895 [Luteibacter sp.]|jgi:hypothetical protein|uniref:hypothetical protein n=1 Tax=Luteibacter sp. TaxID=1886636 RepID=UPI002F3F25F0